ncbi:MAG: multidrug effflux MFS transporter [Pseudolabrys sp.]|nr:multidrug effflux MFS transporter [Pseudolabrys sp.]
MTAIGPLTTDMYLPSLPDIARLMHVSPAQVQLTISSYLVGFATGQLIYGPLSDRFGRKPVLMGATALFTLATALCAMAPSNDLLIVARFFQAVGGCGGIVLSRAIVRDLYSGARAGRELSLIASVMALAPVVAPLIGGVLHAAFGWRSSFVVLTVFGILLTLIIWRLLPETMDKSAREPLSVRSTLRVFGKFLGDVNFLANMGLLTLAFGGLFCWISGTSFVLQGLYGLGPVEFGIAFALGSVGYMTGATLAARIVGPLGLNGTIGVGTAAMAAGGMLMACAVWLKLSSSLSLVIPMAIYLAGMGCVLGPTIAAAMAPYKRNAGAASSLLGFVQQSGAALCGAIVGHLLGESAWPLAGTVAILGVMGLLLWVVSRGVRSRAEMQNQH